MMVTDPIISAQQTAVERARADLELLDVAIVQLQADLVAAQSAEDSHRSALQQLQRRLADRRFELQRAKQGGAADDLIADLVGRVNVLGRLTEHAHADRQQWVQAHSVQAFDPSGRPLTKSLTPTDVARRLAMAQSKRSEVAAELEAALAALPDEAEAPAEGR